MKNLILISIFAVLTTGCVHQSPKNSVATKCRLNAPIIKTHCEAAGVYNTKGGHLVGLPVMEQETGLSTLSLLGFVNTTDN